MYCPKCRVDNPEEAQFCKKCGTKLREEKDSLNIAKESLESAKNIAKEKLAPVSRKALKASKKFASKAGPAVTSFYNKKFLPFYQQKIKPKPKPFVFALIAVVVIIVGLSIYYQGTSSRRSSQVDSLESLEIRFESWAESSEILTDGSEKVLRDWGKEGLELAEEYNKAVKYYFNEAKSVNSKNPEEFKELLEKEAMLDDLSDYEEGYYAFNLLEIKGEKEFHNLFADSIILLNKVRITEDDSETIEAIYQEKESSKIPVGYSFTLNEPEDGRQQTITVIVEGETEGSATVITKEPKDGIKVNGTGSTEDIVRNISPKLDWIASLFRNQNLSASTIVSFLDAQNKERAVEWESKYKDTVFNWRRFDGYETLSSQATFEKTSYYESSSQSLLLKVLLPIKTAYYQPTTEIPFYYQAEQDEWISTNKTMEGIFALINKQTIPAIKPADTSAFTYPKTENCDFSGRDVEIDAISIQGQNSLKGSYSGKVSGVVLLSGNYQTEMISFGNQLPTDFTSYINNNKETVLTAKTFKYTQTGWLGNINCEASPDISISFFNQ